MMDYSNHSADNLINLSEDALGRGECLSTVGSAAIHALDYWTNGK